MKATSRTRTLKCDHEDERGIRRSVTVRKVPAGISKTIVQVKVNCLVLPLNTVRDFEWEEIK